MSKDDEYLYRGDPRARIAGWARSLRYFRFVRSGGGMDGGGDNLVIAVRLRTQQELEAVFAALGVTLQPSLPDPSELGGSGPIRFEAGPLDDPESAKRLSPALGKIRIGEATAFAWYNVGKLELRIADDVDPWRVTDRAVNAASAIETRVSSFSDRLIDPPQDDALCICPKHHPEIWESEAQREVRLARRRRLRMVGWLLVVGAVLALASTCLEKP